MISSLFILGEKLAGKPDSRLKKGLLFAFFEACFIAAPFAIVLFILMKALQTSLTLSTVWWLTGAIFLCVLLRTLCAQPAMGLIFTSAHFLMGHTRIRIADHLRKLPMGFFNRHRSGEIAGTLTSDVGFVEDVWSHLLGLFAANFFLPILVGIGLCFLDWRLGLIVLLSLPTAFLMLAATTPLFVCQFGRVFDAAADTNARIVEYTQGIAILRAFGRHGDGYRRLEKSMERFRDALIRADVAPAPLLSIFGFVIEGSFVLVALLGSHFLIQGTIDPGTFLVFLVVTIGVSKQVSDLGVAMLTLRGAQKALSRVEALLSEKALLEASGTKLIENFNVSVENVTFAYEEESALKGVSVVFPEKAMSALVGKSGSGKSTLAHLIARLWDIPRGHGSILIGGVDIRDIPSEELHHLVTMVFQDVMLFSGSILDNVRIGKPGASREEILAACRSAQAHSFIEKLPQGYDTVLGEDGGSLSGGERQRISIARALLKDAPIVLLDEATASVDASSESEIQKAVDELVQRKTVIVIAHRLKTVQRAAKIVVLDNGCVVEQGSHDELIRKNGQYARLWNEQERAKGWLIQSKGRA